MIVFPVVLCSVTPFTFRLDGCDVFFCTYVQWLLCFSHADTFAIFSVYLAYSILSSFSMGSFGSDDRLLKGCLVVECYFDVVLIKCAFKLLTDSLDVR